MIKMLEQPIYSHRAYVIVGVNKKDPTDIIGYCENSFSMGWTRHWVNLWAGHGKAIAKKNVNELYVDTFCHLYEKGEEDCMRLIKNDKYYKDTYGRFLKKVFSGKASFDEVKKELFDYYIDKGGYSSQSEWNHVRHYPSVIPEGYELKVYRLNSKNCPIICDLRYRHLMDVMPASEEKSKIWSKWDYRNPMFAVKAKVGPDFKWPEDFLYSAKIKKTELSKCKFVKIEYSDLPAKNKKGKEFKRERRSEKQILRKQRRNSFAAKEGKASSRSS